MLLDTSGLLCFLHRDELQHQKAVELLTYHKSILLTHNYVIAELVALALVRRFPQSTVLSYILELVNNPRVEVVWVDEYLHRKAIDLLLTRQDKNYSLCDAISFIGVAESEYEITILCVDSLRLCAAIALLGETPRPRCLVFARDNRK